MDSTTKKLLIAGAVSVVAGALIGYVAGRRRRQNSNLLAALDEIKARALTSLQVDLATIFDQVGLNGGCGWLSLAVVDCSGAHPTPVRNGGAVWLCGPTNCRRWTQTVMASLTPKNWPQH